MKFFNGGCKIYLHQVASLAGAWIEIAYRDGSVAQKLVAPSRERGLKYVDNKALKQDRSVAPLAGAWIEIRKLTVIIRFFAVAPLAGAWIEIGDCPDYFGTAYVAPLAGAWIEMVILSSSEASSSRRSPRGSVD